MTTASYPSAVEVVSASQQMAYVDVIGIGLVGPQGPAGTATDVDGTYQAAVAPTKITGTHTMGLMEALVVITSGTFVMTLPDATAVTQGQFYHVLNNGSGTITLATVSSQTINATTPGTLAAGAKLHLISDGSNWFNV